MREHTRTACTRQTFLITFFFWLNGWKFTNNTQEEENISKELCVKKKKVLQHTALWIYFTNQKTCCNRKVRGYHELPLGCSTWSCRSGSHRERGEKQHTWNELAERPKGKMGANQWVAVRWSCSQLRNSASTLTLIIITNLRTNRGFKGPLSPCKAANVF